MGDLFLDTHANGKHKAVFLDRDGVINRKAPDGEYIVAVNEFDILPRAVDAVARFSQGGFLVFVVTNQRGIARGLVSREEVDRIHQLLENTVERVGGHITKIYVCEHDHHHRCDCRKPEPGMLLRASREFNVDLDASWMVGDSHSDLQAGRRAGCRIAQVGNNGSQQAEIVGATLWEVAQQIVSGSAIETQSGSPARDATSI
jgi:D-glycero-D-manno-heptose 1,7-bisphosphate phosphatase